MKLGDVIGEGAFGTVHKAKWRGTFVAVKTLKKLKASALPGKNPRTLTTTSQRC